MRTSVTASRDSRLTDEAGAAACGTLAWQHTKLRVPTGLLATELRTGLSCRPRHGTRSE
jgi:hypothetical protein